MKSHTSAIKASHKTSDGPSAQSSAGENAVAIAAPSYGIEFIDRLGSAPAFNTSAQSAAGPLAVSMPSDPAEVEAERIADEVMRDTDESAGTRPISTRLTPARIHRRSAGRAAEDEAAAKLPGLIERATASGQRLDPGIQRTMESRFGGHFGDVRVHTDETAAKSARSLRAHAYTIGNNIVFGAGRYALHTHAGQRLLAHELTHVVQQSQNGDLAVQRDVAVAQGREEPPRIRERSKLGLQRQDRAVDPTARKAAEKAYAAAKEAEAINRDYTDAQTYVTDFYSTYARIQDDLAEAAHRAINKFSEISGIPDSRLKANLTYQLIRITLGILPGAGSIIRLFDVLSKGLTLAVEGSRLATIAGVVAQRGAAGVFTATQPGVASERLAATAFLDTLSKFDSEGAAKIEQERIATRQIVEQLGKDPRFRNKVLSDIQHVLGPSPIYEADAIQQFEQEYELQLYKQYYVEHAWINHMPPSLMGTPYTRYAIVDVPTTAQSRILALHKKLNHVAQVSIDERFAEYMGHPEYAEVVKILLNWGVKLYWLRGYVSDKPEELSTGDVLQQPYRGARFREVK